MCWIILAQVASCCEEGNEWPFGFHKMFVNLLTTELLTVPEGGLNSLELVILSIFMCAA
jgi:hypothetical protein